VNNFATEISLVNSHGSFYLILGSLHMTSEEKRTLKKKGKRIVEKRSTALREMFHQAMPALSPLAFRAQRANRDWLREHREHIPAVEISKRFVVTLAEELGTVSPFVECLVCHDVLYTYPEQSTKCSCGALTVTFPKARRGMPPKISARDDKARIVVLTPKG
jgi:hypothetical protein